MAEQMDTPGSNADTSVNGGNKSGAPKDKACPFCQQSFTSSSLGRHLDLYIKEKNPKPADGIHNVEEIRKMRGGITRRQPRNSMSRREGSTPAGTPGVGRPSPGHSDVDMSGNRSPSLRRDGPGGEDGVHYPGKPRFLVNSASWESTGVMNNIPPTVRSGDSARSWNGDGEDRRMEGRSRSVSKQMLAKTTFDQKQKMMDALDNAKAAELALRELLGSLRAAKLRRIEASTIFDFDPLTLDFPSLTLECLPPPPTLHTSSPIATLTSWSISPPSEQQYEALRTFFLNKFQNFRVSCTIATTAPQDDFSYPPTNFFMDTPDPAEVVQRAENDATELENKIADHLRMVFTHWSKLPPNKRAELWALELARNIGRKQEKIQKMKTESELKDQENAHLKMQIEDLSRLQQPREYKISPPATYPFDRQTMEDIGRSGLNVSSIGFSPDDRSQHLDTVVERVVGRWKEVVREARGGGMAAQRLLSGSHDSSSSLVNNTSPNSSNNTANQNNKVPINGNVTQNHGTGAGAGVGSGSDVDADADADAEMDDDAGFVDMTDATHSQQQQQQQPGGVNRAPEAQMQQQLQQQHVGSGHGGGVNSNYRLANGLGSSIHIEGMKGTEKQSCVAGYLRVG